jgi:TolA-binding protein
VQPGGEIGARLRQAVTLFDQGERAKAAEIFTEVLESGGSTEVKSKAYFYLGMIKLFESGDQAGLQDCKNHFDAYGQRFPNGPHQKICQDISAMLGKHIEQSRKQQQRIRALSRRVKELGEEAETLQYKIQKMEEIQQETDRKRKALDSTK